MESVALTIEDKLDKSEICQKTKMEMCTAFMKKHFLTTWTWFYIGLDYFRQSNEVIPWAALGIFVLQTLFYILELSNVKTDNYLSLNLKEYSAKQWTLFTYAFVYRRAWDYIRNIIVILFGAASFETKAKNGWVKILITWLLRIFLTSLIALYFYGVKELDGSYTGLNTYAVAHLITIFKKRHNLQNLTLPALLFLSILAFDTYRAFLDSYFVICLMEMLFGALMGLIF